MKATFLAAERSILEKDPDLAWSVRPSRRRICQLASNHVSPLLCACAASPSRLLPKSFNFNEFLLSPHTRSPIRKRGFRLAPLFPEGKLYSRKRKSSCIAHFVLLCIYTCCERVGEKLQQKMTQCLFDVTEPL